MDITNKISAILTPNKGVGFVEGDRLFQLQPIMPLQVLLEAMDQSPEADRKKMNDILNDANTVVYNGIIYFKTMGMNLKGRLNEVMQLYKTSIKKSVGDMKPLIDIYALLSVEDIASLVEDHIIFVMKKFVRGENEHGTRGLCAMRYFPKYQVRYNNNVWEFPECTICIYIQNVSNLGDLSPEVEGANGENYQHPFVFRDKYVFGQRVCMGSFYNDSALKQQLMRLPIAQRVSAWMKQTIQILVSGYNRNVNPANGHLTESQYSKYLVKPRS